MKTWRVTARAQVYYDFYVDADGIEDAREQASMEILEGWVGVDEVEVINEMSFEEVNDDAGQ